MKGILTFLITLLGLTASLAQVEVKINDQKPSDFLEQYNQKGATKVGGTLVDSISTALKKDSHSPVSSGMEHKVFSEKLWRQHIDSLMSVPFVNIPHSPYEFGKAPKKEVSKEELLKAINDKYFGSNNKSSAPALAKDSLKDTYTTTRGRFSEKELAAMPADLSRLKLPDSTLRDFEPMGRNLIDSKYTQKLDSIRNLNLKAQGIQLQEKKLPIVGTRAELQQKPRFWDKTYVEGVLGISAGDNTVVQASPALGYHFTRSLSLGLGPNLSIRQENTSASYALGVRTLAKAEFFDRQGYLQVEDIVATNNSSNGMETRGFKNQHNVFMGGGWLLSLSAPVTLNFSLLYRITDHGDFTSSTSPWVFRIGISTVNKGKK